MKKRIVMLLAAAMVTLTACGGAGNADANLSANSSADASTNLIADFNPDDFIALGQYKELSVNRLSTAIDDAQVEAELKSRIEALAEPVAVTDRDDVRLGDVVNIDYVGKIDGVAFDGGTDQGYDLTIGSHMFIDGFEDGLIGAKVGEMVALDLTFPENYGKEDLAGKAAVFEVSVNSIGVKPEPSDEVVATITNGDYQTLETFKVYLRDSMEKSLLEEADNQMYRDLLVAAVDNASVIADFPEELIQQKVDLMKKNAQSYAQAYGVDLTTYLSSIGQTENDFYNEINSYSSTAAKESMVMYAIAKAENIEVNDEELDKAIDEYVQLYGYASKDEFIAENDIEEFREYILKSKVEEFLADNAIITTE